MIEATGRSKSQNNNWNLLNNITKDDSTTSMQTASSGNFIHHWFPIHHHHQLLRSLVRSWSCMSATARWKSMALWRKTLEYDISISVYHTCSICACVIDMYAYNIHNSNVIYIHIICHIYIYMCLFFQTIPHSRCF